MMRRTFIGIGLLCASIIYFLNIQQDQVFAEPIIKANNSTNNITVAVVDTGIDASHPAFKGLITKSIDLLQYDYEPQDEHGHGTNVAGVLVDIFAKYKSQISTPTTLNIMPIRALSSLGEGTATKLAEGIRYATEQQADVIVLALGLYENHPQLEKAINDAENQGIVVVAATGNDGDDVRYPAAYATVLAVGGVLDNNQVAPLSNYGNEVDIVAPWKVYTTALNGGYSFEEGTSMAAPHAAIVTALYKSLKPKATPLQIRQQIRQTAQDIENPGWDRFAGYGKVNIVEMLKQTPKADMYELNNKRENARYLPLNKMILAQANTSADRDWYRLNAPNRGTVELRLGNSSPAMQLNVYPANEGKRQTYTISANNPVTIKVESGTNYIELFIPTKDSNARTYILTNQYKIYKDEFENNNRQYLAFVLPLRTQEIVATFDRVADEDWFVFQTERAGTLNIRVSAVNIKFDLSMRFQANNGKFNFVDRYGYGEDESVGPIQIKPGKYYLQVSNADGMAVQDEYDIIIDFEAQTLTTNEPNDLPSQATKLKNLTSYLGQLSNVNITDYYQFTVDKESLFQLNFRNSKGNPNLKVLLLNRDGNILQWKIAGQIDLDYTFMRAVSKGTYFVKLMLLNEQTKVKYTILSNLEPLVSGYRDITNHWAKSAIIQLTQKKILMGYEHFDFAPNKAITRAEASSMIVRAFNLTKIEKINFKDVKNTHWAYDEIAKVAAVNIISGYGNQTFRPDQPVTRAEMSTMIANALSKTSAIVIIKPFRDVEITHWASPAITKLKSLEIINGFTDGNFYPQKSTTRAEFVVALQLALAKQ